MLSGFYFPLVSLGTEDGPIVLKLMESFLKMAINNIGDGWMVSPLQGALANRIRSRKTKYFHHLKGKHVIDNLRKYYFRTFSCYFFLQLRLIFTIPRLENLLLRQCNYYL